MPGPPAARLTDMHTCPMVTGFVPHVGGPIVAPGCPTVLIGMMPAARITDTLVCVGPPDIIVLGAFTTLIGMLPAARIGDMTAHGGVIVSGWPTVLIGDAPADSPAAIEGQAKAASTSKSLVDAQNAEYQQKRDQVNAERAAKKMPPLGDKEPLPADGSIGT
jgi:uncharacterized Zn-binding protein involved in type VI secretion